MLRYVLRRLLESVPVLVLASVGVFMLVRLVPGDPAAAMLGPNATPQDLATLRDQLGLNGSPVIQYLHWVRAVLHFDFGRSIEYHLPVRQLIRTQIEPTLQLALAAYVFSLIVGIGLGIWAARSTVGNMVANAYSAVAIGFPVFVLGIFLLLFLSVEWHLFPTSGARSFTNDPGGALKRLVLPSLSLGALAGAVLLRFVRTSVRQVFSEDYIRTARAKGLSDRVVTFRHALRNALIPVITVAALQLGRLLGGAVIIEIVFSRPGLGRLIVDGVLARDYPLIQALILLFVATFIGVNLVADVAIGMVDPRVRL
jgi:peptide/nickel transport system permease protein